MDHHASFIIPRTLCSLSIENGNSRHPRCFSTCMPEGGAIVQTDRSLTPDDSPGLALLVTFPEIQLSRLIGKTLGGSRRAAAPSAAHREERHRTWWGSALLPSFCFLAVTHSLQDLSSLTRGWTQTTAIKVPSPNYWTSKEFPWWSSLDFGDNKGHFGGTLLLLTFWGNRRLIVF